MATLLRAQQHLASCRQAVASLAPHICRSQTPRLFHDQTRHLRLHQAGLFQQHNSPRSVHRKQCTLPCRSFVVHASAAATGIAGPGDSVKVHYTGTFEDGTQFDSSRGKDPLEFVIGAGTVVPGFEAAVSGLAVGETRKQTVPPKDAYGDWREEMQAKIPTKDLEKDIELEVGTQVRLSNGLEAVVREMTDDYIVIDANGPMAGKTLIFDVELVSLVKGDVLETATFGAGCFWGPELAFQRVPGVVSTSTGYSQGHLENPTYEDVCSGSSGHTEVVQVNYNPQEVKYEDLLKALFEHIDPTQKDGQGNDRGSQYRTGIYYHTPEQQRIAQEFLQKAQADYQAPIATELQEITNFTKAEDYHQGYLAKGGRFGRPQSAAKGCQDPIRCYG